MLDVTFEYLEMVPELLLVAIGVMVVCSVALIVFRLINWRKKRVGEKKCNRGEHDFEPLLDFQNDCNYASGECIRCGKWGWAERSERVHHG